MMEAANTPTENPVTEQQPDDTASVAASDDVAAEADVAASDDVAAEADVVHSIPPLDVESLPTEISQSSIFQNLYTHQDDSSNMIVEEEEEGERVVSIVEEVETPRGADETDHHQVDEGTSTPLLFNRLSTWRQKANENAKTFWRTTNNTTGTTPERPPQRLVNQWRDRVLNGTIALQATTTPTASNTTNTKNLNQVIKEASTAADNNEGDNNQSGEVTPAPKEQEKIDHSNKNSDRSENDDLVDEDDDDDDDDDDDYSRSSYYSSSIYTDESNSGRRMFQWAASSVIDSVQESFRGRYATAAAPYGGILKTATPTKTATELVTAKLDHSQTARILLSPQAEHLQRLMKQLESNQYIMLLGRGMLGVNLKQSYLRGNGVYVDYLVSGGSADKAAIVYVGDFLDAVGDLDVHKGTILTVPKQIAEAKRPVHLIFSTPSPHDPDRITYVDLAIAMMHQVGTLDLHAKRPSRMSSRVSEEKETTEHSRKEETNDAAENEGETPETLVQDNEDNNDNEDARSMEAETGSKGDVSQDSLTDLVQPVSFDNQEMPDLNIDVTFPALEKLEDLIYLSPPKELRDAYAPLCGKRNNECFSIDQLCEEIGVNNNFRLVLQHALLVCISDGRRFPFVATHFVQSHTNDIRTNNSNFGNDNALLMLLVELATYVDLYGVTPAYRRRQMATRIAHKFFLPTQMGNHFVPPMFDFHLIVTDASIRELEAALKVESDDLPRDLFKAFQLAALETLAARPFISYLVSNECARMRGYLRNTAPFINVPLDTVFDSLTRQTPNYAAKNYFIYILVYLLCLNDRESYGEYDMIMKTSPQNNTPSRVEDAASSLCAAIFIRNELLPLLKCAIESKENFDASGKFALSNRLNQLWEIFLAPGVGALDQKVHSSEALHHMSNLRCALNDNACHGDKGSLESYIVACENIHTSAKLLSDDLIYAYAVDMHSKFLIHKFHEWYCNEASKAATEPAIDHRVPPLPVGCIKRLLRKADFPVGMSEHKPTSLKKDSDESFCVTSGSDSPSKLNAECAIIFGIRSVGGFAEHDATKVERITCQNVIGDAESLQPEEVPSTFETYASARPPRQKVFGNVTVDSRKSTDGWEVTLVDFMIPCGDNSSPENGGSALYGTSLSFHRIPSKIITQLSFVSESDYEGNKNTKQEAEWGMVNIALVSRRNNVIAMRETLSLVLANYCPESGAGFCCAKFVETLTSYQSDESESNSLPELLRPFMERASEPWMSKPLGSQQHTFESACGQQLLRCLTPTPLAMLFVTALLEQKIVMTSCRRSVLTSVCSSFVGLLRPLQWCHLFVPRVPSEIALDLLQYPAPFILGFASEDPGIIDIIRELPEDVTLVDLDVGRVILASKFAHNSELGRGSTRGTDEIARALRSQVLHLSQNLGAAFGAQVDPHSWCCDNPTTSMLSQTLDDAIRFEKLKATCQSFLDELLAGTASCCYWIEEALDETKTDNPTKSEPTVLFDEDRYFLIKKLRHQNGFRPLASSNSSSCTDWALPPDDFHLILELFLRSQSMNVFISTRERKDMIFSV